MTADEEKRARHLALYRQMGKLFLYGGWGVALLSMILGGCIVDRLKTEIAVLRAQIKSQP